MKRARKKTIIHVLTPAAFVMAWFVTFSLVLLAIVRAGNTMRVLGVYYSNLSFIVVSYIVVSVVLVLFGVWFASRFYRE